MSGEGVGEPYVRREAPPWDRHLGRRATETQTPQSRILVEVTVRVVHPPNRWDRRRRLREWAKAIY